ncbi:MAG: hypothetical protein D6806_10520 [Deltaproteobacteria bacterium]|nr:MAG: hypothetical protein D6806_10520 [Deltaproteobacteria bacterium]
MRHIAKAAFLFLALSGSVPANAGDYFGGKDISARLGVGLLEFIHLDAGLQLGPEWEVGLSLGGLPIDAILRSVVGLDDITVSASEFTFAGAVDTALTSGAVWVRWYPWQMRFYVEGILAVWKLSAATAGIISHQDFPEGIPVEVEASVWAPLIGVHAGWRFAWEVGAVLDVGLGIDTMQSPGASVTLGGATVEEVRAQSPEAAEILDQVQQELSTSLAQGVEEISKNFTFPTVYVKFGWAFDAW